LLGGVVQQAGIAQFTGEKLSLRPGGATTQCESLGPDGKTEPVTARAALQLRVPGALRDSRVFEPVSGTKLVTLTTAILSKPHFLPRSRPSSPCSSA
jgi:hypothetical protein